MESNVSIVNIKPKEKSIVKTQRYRHKDNSGAAMPTTSTEATQTIRQRAEYKLRVSETFPATAERATTPEKHVRENSQKYFHELQVHQIEVELQNDELRQTLDELELSRNKCAELLDVASSDRFTFDVLGMIRKANFTDAQLLAIERGFLADKSGSTLIADADGKGIFYKRFAAIAKRLETEIRDARDYAENIVETVREPLVVLSSNLKILTANHSYYETFKVTPEATIGNYIYDVGNRQWDIPKLRVLFEDILPSNTAFNGYEVEHDFPGIGRKVILLNARQISRKNIGSHIILLAMEDITIRKQAELALQKDNDELERRVHERTEELALSIVNLKGEIEERKQAERFLLNESAERLRAMEALRKKEQMLIQQSRQAAMGEMIGNIAHQWRQPLNLLAIQVQQLLMLYDYGEFTRESLDSNVTNSMELIQHMSRTIDDFRNYFRPDKGKIEFELSEVITNTLSLIEDSFRNERISIEIVTNDEPVINGYRNEFVQVILNILNNARDVLMEREISDPRVTITISAEGDRAVVSIADNAGGIPEEFMGKIFDPYFTTKGPQTGTGVGLYMSKSIIENNMSGRLTVRNTANGAEFRIEI
jgi:signal transduction histidine kinase